MDNDIQGSVMAISATGLTKNFGRLTVLAGIDISVVRGEIFGVLGPNGSGKTTLLRILCGLLSPSSGTGHCLDITLSAPASLERKRQRKIGYLAQNFTLYNELTITENLLFRARLFSLAEPENCVEHALVKYDLKERSKQLAGKLSGGWRRRLELAACLLHQPDLLMLDEPTTGLDAAARSTFWSEIETLAIKGVTVLVNTHDTAEAERCHRIALLANGRIVKIGAPHRLISDANCTVWWLSGEINGADYIRQLLRLPGVVHAEHRQGQIKLVTSNNTETVSSINVFAKHHGLAAYTNLPHLDDALIQLLHQHNGKIPGRRDD